MVDAARLDGRTFQAHSPPNTPPAERSALICPTVGTIPRPHRFEKRWVKPSHMGFANSGAAGRLRRALSASALRYVWVTPFLPAL